MRYQDDKGLWSGQLEDLPGCSQIGVSHSVFVHKDFRGKRIGGRNHKLHLQRAEGLGYNSLICTVDANNEFEIEILKSNGWTKLEEFESSKTGHTVGLWFKKL